MSFILYLALLLCAGSFAVAFIGSLIRLMTGLLLMALSALLWTLAQALELGLKLWLTAFGSDDLSL